jgi:hypothetical protein
MAGMILLPAIRTLRERSAAKLLPNLVARAGLDGTSGNSRTRSGGPWCVIFTTRPPRQGKRTSGLSVTRTATLAASINRNLLQ